MKVAIYGAGSLGTVLGAFITKGGVNIDLINRNQKHVDGLREHGAIISGTINMTVPVKALLPTEMTEKYDVIFLMTKQLENAKVVEGLIPYLKDDGVICTTQNGLPEVGIAEIIGEKRTYGCTIAWGATMLGEGKCELTSSPDSLTFGLGTLDGRRDDKFYEIKRLLELMGEVQDEENFMGARWSKLLINCAFSGMSAVLGCTFGEVCDNKQSKLCALRIIKECIDVAEKDKIKIEPVQGKDIAKLFNYKNKFKEKISLLIIPLAMKKHRLLKASMLQDIEKGKKCEIDAINGVLCKYGDKVKIETPYNDTVVSVIRKIEKGELKPSFDNISYFKALK